MIRLLIGGIWLAGALYCWALCRAAKRGDEMADDVKERKP